MTREQKAVRTLFERLVRAPLHEFPASRGRIDAPDRKGVYVIYCPRGTVLHVGSTPRARKGIGQRLKDHMAGQSSFTQKYFHRHKRKGPQLREGYSFRCLCVPDPRTRALLEAFAIGRLCPEHIGHGLE